MEKKKKKIYQGANHSVLRKHQKSTYRIRPVVGTDVPRSELLLNVVSNVRMGSEDSLRMYESSKRIPAGIGKTLT